MWSTQLLLFFLGVLLVPCRSQGSRPPPAQRKFNSTAVNALIDSFMPRFKDPIMARIFENCYPNSLDTTIDTYSSDDAFIITGDIDAMWLRDSTNQILPYLPLVSQDGALRTLFRGAVNRQIKSVLIDAYANAFNQGPNGNGHQTDPRKPPMTKSVFEGKYELDSLCAVMKLSYAYWNATGDNSVLSDDWMSAMERILDVITVQQQSTAEDGSNPAYTFGRAGETYPALPVARTGLSKCGFRPSDDETVYAFLIPANAMAVVELRHTAKTASVVNSVRANAIAQRATALAAQIDSSLKANATTTVSGTTIFAYEVDGFGHHNLMDDANVPSLLSLPFLGYSNLQDPLYQNTRKHVLSSSNPWYFSGTVAKGIGSPHTGPNRIWPMSLIIQALTSTDDNEIQTLLGYLVAAAKDTGFMHESFDKNDASRFSRSWFAWANSLFGELIVKIANERPSLIFK
eukprot:TRINITY_DN8772_c0_g1_i1.p1 TRINITY_DN8772_c0_g1~~TRINITY_DN8772_c0_g1_i1.p1  ORF type:complete len:465 (-),score=77.31 TRINITY_DN8772_c0_g1_i1:1268-2641(-)